MREGAMPLQTTSNDVITATAVTNDSVQSLAITDVTVPLASGISLTGTITGAATATGDIFVASFAALAVNLTGSVDLRGMSIAPLHTAGTDADNWVFSIESDTGASTLSLRVDGDEKAIDWCVSYETLEVTDAFNVDLDHTPDAIVFSDVTDALRNATVTSNTVTISGIDNGASFLIAGGTAIIDGVNMGDSGTINNGQTLALRTFSQVASGESKAVSWAVGTESGEWQVTTEVFAAPDEMTIQYGASDDWQGPSEAEVDVFARDYPSLEAAYLQLRTDALAAAAAGDPARPYVLGLEPGAIYRERLSMRNRSFPESHPVRIVTIGGGDRATITGADILSGFVPCTNADADRVGSDFANIYKVNVPAPDFHGNALNLHEDGEFLTHVTDRAQEPENTLFKFNPLDWYTAAEQTAFPDDEGYAGEGPIESYTDPFFLNYTKEQLERAQIMIYGGSNRTDFSPILNVDLNTTLIDGVTPAGRVEVNTGLTINRDTVLERNFALLNILPKLSDTSLPEGRWGFADEGDGTYTIYLRPRNIANLDGKIEYSVRKSCLNTANASNIIIEGVRAVQVGGNGTSDGICIGTNTDSAASFLARRSNITIRECITGKTATGERDNYGAIFVSGVNGLTIENNSVDQCIHGYGIAVFRSSDVIIRENSLTRVEESPLAVFGGNPHEVTVSPPVNGWSENIQILHNHFQTCGREVHSNKAFFYQGCNYVLFKGNVFDDCYGYVTLQECSNFVGAFNIIPDGNRDDNTSGNRAFVDQNNETIEPDEDGFIILFNNQSTPNPLTLSDGDNWTVGALNGTQTTSLYNNIITGLSRRNPDGALYGPQEHNIISIGADHLGASDILIPDYTGLYNDAVNNDFTFVEGGDIDTPGFDMRPVIQSVADAWNLAPVQADTNKRGYSLDASMFDYDVKGRFVDWNTPYIGAENLVADVEYQANAVAFDGNSFLRADSGDFTVQHDVNKALISFWFYVDDSEWPDNFGRILSIGSAPHLEVRFTSNGRLVATIRGDVGGTTEIVASIVLAHGSLSVRTWYHVSVVWDNAASIFKMYIDGDEKVSNSSELIDANIIGADLNRASVGATSTGAAPLTSVYLTDLYVNLLEVVDFSDLINFQKFRTTDGKPVNLGVDGRLPTGNVPAIFLSGNTSDWHVNKGAGSGFNIEGMLSLAASSPSNDIFQYVNN
jgi:hypothetical protein